MFRYKKGERVWPSEYTDSDKLAEQAVSRFRIPESGSTASSSAKAFVLNGVLTGIQRNVSEKRNNMSFAL